MSNGAVNLIVLVGMVLIIASVIAVFYMAASSRGNGRKVLPTAKQRKRFNRKVHPKAGNLLP